MQDLFWAISLGVRALAVAIGWRRAPGDWRIWALFYLLSGLALRTLDILHWYGPHGWYVNTWIAQQVISAGLLVFVVREAVKPTATLTITAILVAIVSGIATIQTHHWPNSPIETVMTICGTASLALGIISAIGSASRRTMHSAILAAFLIGYALLSLAGADYLTKPNIGVAWSMLETVCFGGWFLVALFSR